MRVPIRPRQSVQSARAQRRKREREAKAKRKVSAEERMTRNAAIQAPISDVQKEAYWRSEVKSVRNLPMREVALNRTDDLIDWIGHGLKNEFGAELQSSSNEYVVLTLPSHGDIRIDREHSSNGYHIKMSNVPVEIRQHVDATAKSALAKLDEGKFPPLSLWKFDAHTEFRIRNFLLYAIQRANSDSKEFENKVLAIAMLCKFRILDDVDEQGARKARRFEIVFQSPGQFSSLARYNARIAANRICDLLALTFKELVNFEPSFLSPVGSNETDFVALHNAAPDYVISPHGMPIGEQLFEVSIRDPSQEIMLRFFRACSAFHNAIHQRTTEAELSFLIIAIEAISLPNSHWRDKNALARFASFIATCETNALRSFDDSAPNFPSTSELRESQAFRTCFGEAASAEKFAKKLYSRARSHPLHAGDFGDVSGMAVEPIQQFTINFVHYVQQMIVAFAARPWTPLAGHPKFATTRSIELPIEAWERLRHIAEKDNKTISDIVQTLIVEKSDKNK